MAFHKSALRRSPDLEILGVKLHRVGSFQLHDFIRQCVREGTKGLVFNVNVHCMVLAWKNEWVRNALNQAHVVYCDGDGVRWGAAVLGYEPPPKVAFTRWIWELAKFCEDEKLRMYFLGSKPGIAAKAADEITRLCPRLEIAGVQDGYFAKEGPENDRVVEAINRSGAHVLVVGFGMPYQEKWILENWQKIQVNIFLPGGAVLDYASGLLGQAPQWMIDWHLEWLFRIWEDPKRLFIRYAYDLPVFFLCILKEKLKARRKGGAA